MIDFVQNREQEAIDNLPFSEFIALNEAAEILGYTKQAFSKNPRIRRGMILSGTKGGRKYYVRKSVELFKVKKSGKYRLVPNPDKEIFGELLKQTFTPINNDIFKGISENAESLKYEQDKDEDFLTIEIDEKQISEDTLYVQ